MLRQGNIVVILLIKAHQIFVKSLSIVQFLFSQVFHLGENRKMSYCFSSFLEKTYIIPLLFEVELPRNPKIIEPRFSMKDIPLDLFVQCFKLTGKEEKLMFAKHYSSTQD